jgi:hypothetical protein
VTTGAHARARRQLPPTSETLLHTSSHIATCVVQNEAPGDHDVVYAYSWGVFSQHCREARTRARERKSDGARRRRVVDEKDSARAVGEYDDDGDDDDDDESTEC